jgi:hypothetical protein
LNKLEAHTQVSDSLQKPKGTAHTRGKCGQETLRSDTKVQPTKKKKASKTNLALPLQAVQPKMKKAKAAPEPHNDHPGVVNQPRQTWTSVQVAEEKAAQQEV